MKITLEFTIELKEIFRAKDQWRVPILAVTYLHVCPAGKGLGRDLLTIISQMAERMECECAAIWAESKDFGFYEKCGWFVSKVEKLGKYLVLSKQFKADALLTEAW